MIMIDKVKNTMISQFQVGYMSFPGLNQNMDLKDQVEINMGLSFDKK